MSAQDYGVMQSMVCIC